MDEKTIEFDIKLTISVPRHLRAKNITKTGRFKPGTVIAMVASMLVHKDKNKQGAFTRAKVAVVFMIVQDSFSSQDLSKIQLRLQLASLTA